MGITLGLNFFAFTNCIINYIVNRAFIAANKRDPNQGLFVWAVVFGRIPLAMIFWKKCPDQIGSALVASLIFTSLAREAKWDGKLLLAEELNAKARFVTIFCRCLATYGTRR